jgi:hypothetical protein
MFEMYVRILPPTPTNPTSPISAPVTVNTTQRTITALVTAPTSSPVNANVIQGENYKLEIHRSIYRRESTVFNAFDDTQKTESMKLQEEPSAQDQEDSSEVLDPSFKLTAPVDHDSYPTEQQQYLHAVFVQELHPDECKTLVRSVDLINLPATGISRVNQRVLRKETTPVDTSDDLAPDPVLQLDDQVAYTNPKYSVSVLSTFPGELRRITSLSSTRNVSGGYERSKTLTYTLKKMNVLPHSFGALIYCGVNDGIEEADCRIMARYSAGFGEYQGCDRNQVTKVPFIPSEDHAATKNRILNGLVGLEMQPCTIDEWESIPHAVFTSDIDWDPLILDGGFSVRKIDGNGDFSTYDYGTVFHILTKSIHVSTMTLNNVFRDHSAIGICAIPVDIAVEPRILEYVDHESVA